ENEECCTDEQLRGDKNDAEFDDRPQDAMILGEARKRRRLVFFNLRRLRRLNSRSLGFGRSKAVNDQNRPENAEKFHLLYFGIDQYPVKNSPSRKLGRLNSAQLRSLVLKLTPRNLKPTVFTSDMRSGKTIW